MPTALDPKPFRASNNPYKLRPPVPSCTPPLNHHHPGSSGQSGNLAIIASPATTAAAESPAVLWGAKSAPRRHSLRAGDGFSTDLMNTDLTANLLKEYTTTRRLSLNLMDRTAADCSAQARNPMHSAHVKRWAGLTRTASDWDGLRRDPELWLDDGDCYVHLYARGQSRRGPSFCVPFNVLRESKCGAMFSLCFAQTTPVGDSSSTQSRRVSGGFSTPLSSSSTVELYIPAPEEASREESFKWHITTRNFFAFVFHKPLVGTRLGETFVELQDRMQLFRSGQVNNGDDFLDYAESQGYRDFVDCPDYALAMLQYAEHFKRRAIWIDAFAHCVGMNNTLSSSSEFAATSRLTQALITKAYLEMDIQLGKVSTALNHFLGDDLSSAYLGLSTGARSHLDRFRTFLHGFYVEKFGYWPPLRGSTYSKALHKSMYFDFKNLYDYLVDSESTVHFALQKPASGGICVLQNVNSFDQRHNFSPLSHPLPLIPDHEPLKKKTESQKNLRTFTLGSKQAKTDRYLTIRAALTAATNSHKASLTSSPIVQAYMRFERQCALNTQREEKVSMADARKVRWLLIYGTLQYLVSALRAPKEVRDVDEPEYPLCCLVTEKSPWQVGTKALKSPVTASVNIPEAINNYLSESNCPVPNQLTPDAPNALMIQPDCQTDDYFAHTNPDATPSSSRPLSIEVPAPLRISGPTRDSSIRSFRRLSLSGRSSRRNSVVLKNKPHCDLVHGHGNGLNTAVQDSPSQPASRRQSFCYSKRSSDSSLPEGAIPGSTSWLRPITPDDICHTKAVDVHCDSPAGQSRTSILDSLQMDQLISPVTLNDHQEPPDSSNSTTSAESPFWSDEASSTSSKSSTHNESIERKSSTVEESGLLGGLVPLQSTPVKSSKVKRRSSSLTKLTVVSNRRSEFRFGFSAQNSCLSEKNSPVSDASVDSTIGVALSAPPPAPNFAPPSAPIISVSSECLPLPQKPRPLSRSFSTDAVPLSKAAISPLQMNPPPPPQIKVPKKRSVTDIFSARTNDPGDSSVTSKSASESSLSILNAIPRSISRTPQTSQKIKYNAKKAADQHEKERKKDWKKSLFWRR